MHLMEDHSMHGGPEGHDMSAMPKEDHTGHGTNHSGHEQMFRT